MGFGVAIGEGEICGAIMIGSGEVTPFVFVEVIDKKAVINGVGMFIHEDENGRGRLEIG